MENKNEGKIKYNAFISYNHNPRDIEVAKNLQAKLERYRVPKGLKTAKGVDDIERVFLDVGELGVAADLNDTIKDALDNTDHLIVIASPESRASQWCHKEVEHFLKTHTADQILTVLTDGEPIDVLPEEVMHQKVVSEDGTVTYVDREPLSCDYRNGIKEGNKKELERLVAGIIGCRYDDLVQRQRQYKMRRMAIAFSALTAVMVVALSYFIWSNRTIAKNYNNSLKEQSRSIALQSENAMSGGDKVGAIKYALKALPSEGDERPVVAEAVHALSRATEAYQPQTDGIEATRELLSDKSLYNIEVTDEEDRDVLAATTYKGDIYIIDTKNGEHLAEDYLKELAKDDEYGGVCLLPGDSEAVVIQYKKLTALNYVDGKELWSIKSKKDDSFTPSASEFGKEKLLVTGSHYDEEVSASEVATCIDLNSGKVEFEATIPNKKGKSPYVRTIEVSPDDSMAAMICEYYIDNKMEFSLFGLDLKTGKIKEISTDGIAEFDDLAFTESGRLVVCGVKEERDVSLTQVEDRLYDAGGTARHQSITSTKTVALRCLDEKAENELWRSDYKETFSGYSEIERYRRFSKDKVIVVSGSKLREFDEDGKENVKMEAQSRIKYAYRMTDGNGINAMLEDGGAATYTDGNNYVHIFSNFFHDSIVLCEKLDNRYYLVCYDEDGGGNFRILKYVATTTGDKKWEPYEKTEDLMIMSEDVAPYEDSFIQAIEENGTKYIERIEALSGKSLWKTEIDKTKVLYNINDIIDPVNDRIIVGISEETDYTNNKTKISINSIELKDGEPETIDIYTETPGFLHYVEGITDDGRIVLSFSDYESGKGSLGFVDTENKSIDTAVLEDARDDSSSDKKHYDRAHDMFFTAYEDCISAYKTDGSLIYQIKDMPYKVKAVHGGYDDILYVLGDSAASSEEGGRLKLYRYDINSGKESDNGVALDESLISGSLNYIFSGIEITDLSDDEYLLRIADNGMIIDKESGLSRADLSEMKAYNENVKQFYVGGGHAPYRSVPELIKEAEDMIS